MTTASTSISSVTLLMAAPALVAITIQGTEIAFSMATKEDTSATSAKSRLIMKELLLLPCLPWAPPMQCSSSSVRVLRSPKRKILLQAMEGSQISTLPATTQSPSSEERSSSTEPMEKELPVESLASDKMRYLIFQICANQVSNHEPDGERRQETCKACSC